MIRGIKSCARKDYSPNYRKQFKFISSKCYLDVSDWNIYHRIISCISTTFPSKENKQFYIKVLINVYIIPAKLLICLSYVFLLFKCSLFYSMEYFLNISGVSIVCLSWVKSEFIKNHRFLQYNITWSYYECFTNTIQKEKWKTDKMALLLLR